MELTCKRCGQITHIDEHAQASTSGTITEDGFQPCDDEYFEIQHEQCASGLSLEEYSSTSDLTFKPPQLPTHNGSMTEFELSNGWSMAIKILTEKIMGYQLKDPDGEVIYTIQQLYDETRDGVYEECDRILSIESNKHKIDLHMVRYSSLILEYKDN